MVAAALLSLVDEGKREKWVVVVPTCKSAPPLESLPPKTESSEDELSSALDNTLTRLRACDIVDRRVCTKSYGRSRDRYMSYIHFITGHKMGRSSLSYTIRIRGR